MIVDDRKESCCHKIADDRNRSQSHTCRSAEMSNVLARCACGKIKANNMVDIEEEISLQANLFLFLVLKRRQRQLQNRRKHRKIFIKRQDKLNLSPIFSQLFLSLKFLLLVITVVNSLIPHNFLHKFLVSNVTIFNASHV